MLEVLDALQIPFVAAVLEDGLCLIEVQVGVLHQLLHGETVDIQLRELDRRGIPSIDLLGPAITVISTLTGEEPHYETGRRVDTEVQEV